MLCCSVLTLEVHLHRQYYFNLSTACLSNSTFFLFFFNKAKANREDCCCFTQCNHVHQAGWCIMSGLLPLYKLSLPFVLMFSVSPSLHISALSLIPLQRLTETQEHVSQLPLHPLWLEFLCRCYHSSEIDWKYIKRKEQWFFFSVCVLFI